MKIYNLFLYFVIAIVALWEISSMSVAVYHNLSTDYQIREAMEVSWVMKTAIQEYYLEHQSLAQNNDSLGLATYGATNEYVLSSVSNNGIISLQLGHNAKAELQNSLIIYQPQIKDNTISWTCSSSNNKINQKLLNQYC